MGLRGLLVAAPQSGSGKTTLTLGLLRALSKKLEGQCTVYGAKSGPDYIDPAFHSAATGHASMNLDAWAMDENALKARLPKGGLVVVEGAMGLFDGAPPIGCGSSAHLAKVLGLPVVLVVDAARMSYSVAALIQGFAAHDPEVKITGVLLNNVGSERHSKMLQSALGSVGIPVLGTLHRHKCLKTPSRHLGLVQAKEIDGLENFIADAANLVEAHVDLDSVLGLSSEIKTKDHRMPRASKKIIALADELAFGFTYPHLVQEWTASGHTIKRFSPLADDAVPDANEVYLPGGYPELHAARLSGNTCFLDSLRNAAQNIDVYGECGGYMVLGKTLVDANGVAHQMAGLLDLDTSFASPERHLGYRVVRETAEPKDLFSAHEFHYAKTLRAEGSPLFDVWDAAGNALPPMGLRQGRVKGSFAHIIDKAPAALYPLAKSS